MNHGVFKALLFLSAGAVIHGAMGEEGDMRVMGGLIRVEPLIYQMVLIGAMSLGGIPYLTGFYSKDLILELVYERHGGGVSVLIGGFCGIINGGVFDETDIFGIYRGK